jgi:hypothetical protein
MSKRTRTTIEQFATGGPAMTAYYIAADDETIKLDLKSTPVIGWIVKRTHYADGTTEDEITGGVLNTEFNTVEDVSEVFSNTNNTELVGVFPAGEDPADADIDLARSLLLDRLRTVWQHAERMQEPHRTKRRETIARWAEAVGEVAA